MIAESDRWGIRGLAVVDGVLVTGVLQTALDCMCTLPFPEALAIADSVVRFYPVDATQLAAYVEERGARRSGIATARRAACHANGLSENGGESLARGIMIEEGFCEPELQVEYVDPLTGCVSRVDYRWILKDGSVLLAEHDGNVKFEDPRMLGSRTVAAAARDERLRESRLTVGGARIMRFTPAMVHDRAAFVQLLELYGVPRVRNKQ